MLAYSDEARQLWLSYVDAMMSPMRDGALEQVDAGEAAFLALDRSLAPNTSSIASYGSGTSSTAAGMPSSARRATNSVL
jgi:hypothetical protein